MKKVAVILSGCGVFDGSEIHEAVLSLLAIDRLGASYQCFAPDREQLHVVNHATGEVSEGESRNVLVEAARIARGNIKPVTELEVDEFDALVLPGGFGAAKNLCDFAINGVEYAINTEVKIACQAFATAAKPAAYFCIAPALIARVYPEGVEATIGCDPDTSAALNAMGIKHVECPAGEYVVDHNHKVISSPAYMYGQSTIAEVAAGIDKAIAQLLALA